MKKITVGLLVAVVAMAFFVGCSNFGAAGNPTELTGTWTGATTSFGNPTSVAGEDEGTWESDVVTYPTPTSSVTDLSGVTMTTYYDTTTTESVDTSVVAADGSYVRTTTDMTTTAARAAIPAVLTGTSQTLGYGAIDAGSETLARVISTTVTLNPDLTTYTVRTVTTYSGVASGSYIGDIIGAPYSMTLTGVTQTRTVDSTDANVSPLTWSTPGTQITLGAGLGTANDSQTDTDYSLVITDAGDFTLTTTTTLTNVAPGDGGTRVTTEVMTGTVLGATGTGYDAGATLVTFSTTNVATTYVGTGTLISASYPATAETVTQAQAFSATYSYIITKGTSATFLQIFNPGLIFGYTQPWAPLTKS